MKLLTARRIVPAPNFSLVRATSLTHGLFFEECGYENRELEWVGNYRQRTIWESEEIRVVFFLRF